MPFPLAGKGQTVFLLSIFLLLGATFHQFFSIAAKENQSEIWEEQSAEMPLINLKKDKKARSIVYNTTSNINKVSAFVERPASPALRNINTRIDPGKKKRYDGVVIATKVKGTKQLSNLKIWVCLINTAFNGNYKYDIVIFTTLPWSEEQIHELQNASYPANLTIALEGPPLDDQLAAMAPEEIQFLRKRCQVKNETEKLTWNHLCADPPRAKKSDTLGYAWQAEFRAYHIWTHPALKKYTYMMWLDTDALVAAPWVDVDPVKTMIENDLTVLYSGWPYGKSQNRFVQKKIYHFYNEWICKVKWTKPNGAYIFAKVCKDPQNDWFNLLQVAGNHHITNLNVFRKPIHQAFLKNLTGDYRFSRQFDDQLAVTIVGVMEQHLENKKRGHTVASPEFRYSLWHESSNNITLNIAHHGMYDTTMERKAPRNKKVFYNTIKKNWKEIEKCGQYFPT